MAGIPQTLRTWWKTEEVLKAEPYDFWTVERRKQVPEEQANVISSLTTDGRHMPALDIDVPARLLPSSTPGHGHLYIDVPMSWWRYRMLLRQLHKAGIIERGFYDLAIHRRQTFLRRPGVTKHNEATLHATMSL